MGLTVLDAGVVAGYLDADDAHHKQARAALRAGSGRLRLPDALVLATGAELGAQEIVTTDQRWPEVGLPVTVLGR